VANGRHYGGGNVVEETAEIDDGRLDLYSVEMMNLWKLALKRRSFHSGTRRLARGAHGYMHRVQHRDGEADASHTDCDIVTSTPAHFKVYLKAISVFRLRPWAVSGDYPGAPSSVQAIWPHEPRGGHQSYDNGPFHIYTRSDELDNS
jgi:hypothetical protein